MCSFSRCKLGTPFQRAEDMFKTGMGGKSEAGMVDSKKVRGLVQGLGVVHRSSCHSSLISLSPTWPTALWEMVEEM